MLIQKNNLLDIMSRYKCHPKEKQYCNCDGGNCRPIEFKCAGCDVKLCMACWENHHCEVKEYDPEQIVISYQQDVEVKNQMNSFLNDEAKLINDYNTLQISKLQERNTDLEKCNNEMRQSFIDLEQSYKAEIEKLQKSYSGDHLFTITEEHATELSALEMKINTLQSEIKKLHDRNVGLEQHNNELLEKMNSELEKAKNSLSPKTTSTRKIKK